MKLFLDTGPIVAFFNNDDTHHERAREVLGAIASGELEYDRLFISDYIFDEAVTVVSARTRNYALAETMGNALRDSNVIQLLWVDELVFEEAWKGFVKFKDTGLSFTDICSVTLMREYGIDTVFSFDKHFHLFKELNVLN